MNLRLLQHQLENENKHRTTFPAITHGTARLPTYIHTDCDVPIPKSKRCGASPPSERVPLGSPKLLYSGSGSS